MSLSSELWSFESRWNLEIAALGFTAVPNALLEAYSFLGLTPSQFLTLVNIDSFRWSAEKDPFPSIETLADRTGLTQRSVTRNITALEREHGLITRIPRSYSSNAYSFEGCIETLTAFIRWNNYGNPSRHN